MDTLQQLQKEYRENPSEVLKSAIIDYTLEFADSEEFQEFLDLERNFKDSECNCEMFMYNCGEFSTSKVSLVKTGCRKCSSWALFTIRKEYLESKYLLDINNFTGKLL